MTQNDLKRNDLAENLLVTVREARDLLGGISSSTLNRWAKDWNLRKIGHLYIRSDIVAAVRKHGEGENR